MAESRYSDDRLDDRFRELDNFRIALSRLPDTMARLATEVENLSLGRLDNRDSIAAVETRLTKRLDEVASTCKEMDRKWDAREAVRQEHEAEEEQSARQRRLVVAIACGTGLLSILTTITASLLGLIGHG